MLLSKYLIKFQCKYLLKKLGVAGISSKLSMKLVESFDPGICVESQNIKIDYKQLNEIDDKIKNRIEIIKKKRRTKPIF